MRLIKFEDSNRVPHVGALLGRVCIDCMYPWETYALLVYYEGKTCKIVQDVLYESVLHNGYKSFTMFKGIIDEFTSPELDAFISKGEDIVDLTKTQSVPQL